MKDLTRLAGCPGLLSCAPCGFQQRCTLGGSFRCLNSSQQYRLGLAKYPERLICEVEYPHIVSLDGRCRSGKHSRCYQQSLAGSGPGQVYAVERGPSPRVVRALSDPIRSVFHPEPAGRVSHKVFQARRLGEETRRCNKIMPLGRHGYTGGINYVESKDWV